MNNKHYILLSFIFFLGVNLGAETENPFKIIDTLSGKEKLNSIVTICENNYRDYAQEAALYCQQGIVIAESLNDKTSLAKLISVKAMMDYSFSRYDSALNHMLKALQIREEIGDDNEIGESYNDLGLVYWKLKDLDHAETFFKKSLKLLESSDNLNGQANALNNCAIILWERGNYEECLTFLEKVLKIKIQLNDTKDIIMAHNNIGMLYTSMKAFKKAEDILLKGQKLAQDTHSIYGILYLNNTLGKMYIDSERYTQANTFLDETLKLTEKHHFDALRMEALQLYHALFLKQNDFQNALHYHEQYTALKDKIYSEKTSQKIEELKIQYETEKMFKEISTLKKQQKLEKNEKLALSIAVFLAIIIIILTLNRYYLKKKSEEKLMEQVKIKNRLFSIIAHDLRGLFAPLMGYTDILQHKFNAVSDEKKLQLIEKIHHAVTKTLKFLESLLEWGSTQMENQLYKPEDIDLKSLILEIPVSDIAISRKQLSFKTEIPDNITVYGDKNMISTVLRNLITNALKFTPAEGTIKVVAECSDKHIHIHVSDNGVGIPEEFQSCLFCLDTKYKKKGTDNEEGSGLGLIICKELIEKNNGSISVQSEEGKGTTFTVTLPSTCS